MENNSHQVTSQYIFEADRFCTIEVLAELYKQLYGKVAMSKLLQEEKKKFLTLILHNINTLTVANIDDVAALARANDVFDELQGELSKITEVVSKASGYAYTEQDVIQAVNYEWEKCQSPHAEKKALMIIGQPAAGKSVVTTYYTERYVNIDADDYRIYHPAYYAAEREYGAEASKYTGAFAGQVCERLIDCVAKQGINMIIQGTGRNIETVRKTIDVLRNHGYTVELKVVACPIKLSTLGIYRRYYQMLAKKQYSRFSDLEHTKIVLKNLPANVDQLYEAQLFDTMEIVNRQNETLWRSAECTLPSATIQREYTRPLTEAEEAYFDATKRCIDAYASDRSTFDGIMVTIDGFIRSL